MPRIHLQVSTLELLNNDRINSLETVDGKHVITEDIPDYLSKDTQGWILCLCWLCGIKLPQNPSKEFPSQRGTTVLSVLNLHLMHISGQGKSAAVGVREKPTLWNHQGAGDVVLAGTLTIPSPGRNLDYQSVLVVLSEGLVLRPRSKRGFTLPSGLMIW